MWFLWRTVKRRQSMAMWEIQGGSYDWKSSGSCDARIAWSVASWERLAIGSSHGTDTYGNDGLGRDDRVVRHVDWGRQGSQGSGVCAGLCRYSDSEGVGTRWSSGRVEMRGKWRTLWRGERLGWNKSTLITLIIWIGYSIS